MITHEINNNKENEIKFIANKSFEILKYVFFINNILIYPEINNYYNEKIYSMPKIEDLMNIEDSYFQSENNIFYEFNINNLNLKVSFFIDRLFLNINISPEKFLLDIFEEVNYDYISILHCKYKINNIKNFEKDYKSFIFRKYIRKNFNIKINEFNFDYYNLNKIIKN